MDIDKEQREQLKSWLRRYQELQADANRLWDRLYDLRSRIEAARTSHLDGLPHGSSGDADRIGGIVSELEEVETEAREAQEEATAVRREIAAAIKQIHAHGGRIGVKSCGCDTWTDCGGRIVPKKCSEMIRHIGTGQTCICAGRLSCIRRHLRNL